MLKTHYAGKVVTSRKKGTLTVLAGWAACCSGDRASQIRRIGNHTYEPRFVTCKRCQKMVDMTLGQRVGEIK